MRIYKASKKRKKTKRFIVALSILFPIIGVVFYIVYVSDPIIVNSTYAQIETQATSYVSDAIEYSMINGGYEYSDFVTIKYDSDGDISSIIVNTITLNLLARDVARSSQIYIDKIIDEGVKIPLGTLTGINFLAGRGVKVNFKLVPVGSVHVGFKSDFLTAGINQTLHKISLVVSTDMTIVMPLSSKIISFKTDVVFCENLIVGDVPSVYLSGDLLQ